MYKTIFWGVLIYHAVLWILVPMFTLDTAGLDPVEMVAWGRGLDFGYFKHPPLPSVIVIGLDTIFPTHMAVFVASQSAIFLTAVGVWKIAQKYVPESSAMVATLMILITPYTTWISPEWNHNIVQMPLWIWSLYAFYKICETHGKNLGYFALLAGISALGMYAKYSMAILYMAMALYAIGWRRDIIRIWGVVVFGGVFGAVIAPHIWWVIQTDFMTFTYAQDRGKEFAMLPALGSFLGAQVANVVFVVIGMRIARHKHVLSASSSAPLSPVADGHFLMAMIVLPFIVVVCISLGTGLALHSSWGYPFLSLVPLGMVWVYHRKGYTLCLKKSILWVWGVTTLVAGYYAYHYTHIHNRGHYPAQELATHIQQKWRVHMDTPLAYVAGNQWNAGSISMYAPDTPKFIVYNNPDINPSLDFDHISDYGYMLVWRPDESYTPLGKMIAQGVIHVPHHGTFGDIKATLHWGIVKGVP